MLKNLNCILLDKISAETINKYQNSADPILLDMWQKYGCCKCLDGLVWIINPSKWEGVLLDWLPNLPNPIAFARTAFGCIYVYSEGTAYYLDVLEKDLIPIWGNLEMLFDHFFRDSIYLDEILDRDLFFKAVNAYGDLDSNECFGFHPALSIGGVKALSNIKKVAIREHLHILLHL